MYGRQVWGNVVGGINHTQPPNHHLYTHLFLDDSLPLGYTKAIRLSFFHLDATFATLLVVMSLVAIVRFHLHTLWWPCHATR